MFAIAVRVRIFMHINSIFYISIVNKYDNYIPVIIDNNQWLCYP